MEQRQDEFAILTARAEAELLDECVPSGYEGAYCVLLVCTQPSFAFWHSWTMFSLPDTDTFLVRHIAWDRPFDARRFRDPMEGLRAGWHTVPTTHRTSGVIAEARLMPLMHAIQQARQVVWTFHDSPQSRRQPTF